MPAHISLRSLWFPALLLLLCAPMVAGCTGNRNKKMTDLYGNIHGFHQSMRHARYSSAGRAMISKIRGDFLGRYEELGEDYRILEVDLDQVVMQGEGDYAEVTAHVRWVRVPDMVVKKEKISEVWGFANDTWVMIYRKHEGVDKEDLPAWEKPWLKSKDAQEDIEKTADIDDTDDDEENEEGNIPRAQPKGGGENDPVHRVSEGSDK